MNIYIDIETLRSPEEHRLQILEETKANFKAPSTLTKAQAVIDLGLTDYKEIKFISKDDMIARWEKELAESKAGDVAQALWEKTSFNPDVAPIACICISHTGENGQVKTVNWDVNEIPTEKAMLQMFHNYVMALCSKLLSGGTIEYQKPNFIGHYITKFDLPFIWKRSVINDVVCVSGVKWNDARHVVNCYDTMTAWAGYGNSISADNLASLLGLKGKTEGMDGSMVYDEWQKDPQKVINYCHDDVAMIKRIHERLIK